MEGKNLEQVKELINRIADYYDLPSEEETNRMQQLTGMDWGAEELQLSCCEYWSHHSLAETAYLMFHGTYPPVHEENLVFWNMKPGVTMDDQAVYEQYRLGKGTLKAVEPLPLEEILHHIRTEFSGWQENVQAGAEGKSWRFDCLDQSTYWSDTHFWIFEYGRETDVQREHQLLSFSCHNLAKAQIHLILSCTELFQCSLHIREERNL